MIGIVDRMCVTPQRSVQAFSSFKDAKRVIRFVPLVIPFSSPVATLTIGLIGVSLFSLGP